MEAKIDLKESQYISGCTSAAYFNIIFSQLQNTHQTDARPAKKKPENMIVYFLTRQSSLLTWYSRFTPEEHLRLALVPYFAIAAVNYSNTELPPIHFTKID